MDALKKLRLTEEASIKEALQSLPKSLHETYVRILSPIDGRESSAKALAALQWVMSSARPLFVEELIDACATNADAGPISLVFDKDRRLTPHNILKLLDNLVTVNPPIDTLSEMLIGVHTITLAHFSVQEFLTGPDIKSSTVSRFHIEARLSHRFLAKNCFACLFQCNSYDERHGLYHLRRYAWYNWDRHILPNAKDRDVQIRRKALRLYKALNPSLISPSALVESWDDSRMELEATTRWLARAVLPTCRPKSLVGFGLLPGLGVASSLVGLVGLHVIALILLQFVSNLEWYQYIGGLALISASLFVAVVSQQACTEHWSRGLPRLLEALNIPFFFEDYDDYFDKEPLLEKQHMERRYQFRHNLLHNRDIRLIALLPCLDDDSEIRCKLSVVSLDHNPIYDALSYTWGNNPEHPQVMINGAFHSITANLESILRNLRYRQENSLHLLWVDALCMDMENFGERNSQVALIGDIYRQSQEVVVGLGRTGETDEEGIEFLKTLTAELTAAELAEASPERVSAEFIDFQRLVLDPENNWRWQSVLGLFASPWWQRIWVVQEIVLATNATLFFGELSLNFGIVEHATKYAGKMQQMITANISTSQELSSQQLLMHAGWQSAVKLSRTRSKMRIKHHIELPELLGTFITYGASYPGDKLYALLGLVSPLERSHHLLQPDYAISEGECFFRLAVYLLSTYRSLDLFSYVSYWNGDLGKRQGWVPGFGEQTERVPLQLGIFEGLTTPRIYSAGGSDPANFKFSQEYNILKLDGVEFDVVSHLSGTIDGWGHAEGLKSLGLDNPGAPEVQLQGGETFMTAYWRAILVDRFDVLGLPTTAPTMLPNSEDEEKVLLIRPDLKARLRFCAGRQLFLSETGRLGLAPVEAQVGDVVVVFPGGAMPCILRPNHSAAGNNISLRRVASSPRASPATGLFRGTSQHQLSRYPTLHLVNRRVLEWTHLFIGEWYAIASPQKTGHILTCISSYVNGIMHGEVVKGLANGRHRLQEFLIY